MCRFQPKACTGLVNHKLVAYLLASGIVREVLRNRKQETTAAIIVLECTIRASPVPSAGEWNVGGWSRGKSKSKRKECGDTSPDSETLPQNKEEGFKVFVKVREGGEFSSANPLKLAKELKKELGDVLHVCGTRSGTMSIICKSVARQAKALKINHLWGTSFEG